MTDHTELRKAAEAAREAQELFDSHKIPTSEWVKRRDAFDSMITRDDAPQTILSLLDAKAERDKFEQELWDVNDALGYGRFCRVSVETIKGYAKQHEAGLDLFNAVAHVFQVPDDLEARDFNVWAKEQTEDNARVRAELTTLRAELAALREAARGIFTVFQREEAYHLSHRLVDDLHALRAELEKGGRDESR